MSSPDVLFGQLFIDVQLGHVFADSKTFVDCTPKQAPDEILAQYEAQKTAPGFDLSAFVQAHFHLPEQVASDFVSDPTIPTADHINRLWDRLTRPADVSEPHSSRVPLPHPYVVPGGRFREIFYWDSYFTMLGLKEAGRVDLIRGMIDNFAYLIDTVGFIPNGNRTYFLSRSQPPFFALMVELLAGLKEQDYRAVMVRYLPQLEKEYAFWMDGADNLAPETPVVKRVVWMPDGSVLNRYWDDTPRPRPEAYRQELELNVETEQKGLSSETLYTHIRSACESGWDFSSRWFADGQTMASIQTADLVPVDLNCLLARLEYTLSGAYEWAGKTAESEAMLAAFERRGDAINQFFWHEKEQFFTDFDLKRFIQTNELTLAGVFPLFTTITTTDRMDLVMRRLRKDFLCAGGWVTSLRQTGQQWDSPNGWAPLQWVVYYSLVHCWPVWGDDTPDAEAIYEEYITAAREGRDRWLALNDKVFRATGKMMEKYNVVDAALTTGGGEYPNQDGFGWTNGVYLALSAERDREKS
jgi:alpha,alpha-trehalase